MEKAMKALAVGFLLFTLIIPPATAASKTVKVTVKLDRIELVSNDHVGNDWYTTASINGKEIQEGSSITLNVKSSDSLNLKAYAEEQDKVPDIGTKSASVKVSSISKTLTKSLVVKVVENRGRYSGHSAEWKFVFSIQK